MKKVLLAIMLASIVALAAAPAFAFGRSSNEEQYTQRVECRNKKCNNIFYSNAFVRNKKTGDTWQVGNATCPKCGWDN